MTPRYPGAPMDFPGPRISCVCGARAGYRITSTGGAVFHRCPACANTYDNARFEKESLPHVKAAFEGLVYASYRHQRITFPHVTPERWAESFRENFKPRIVQLEERFQREVAEHIEAHPGGCDDLRCLWCVERAGREAADAALSEASR